MAKNNNTATAETEKKKQTPKKCNLLKHHSVKHLLDESVTDIVKSRGHVEDVVNNALFYSEFLRNPALDKEKKYVVLHVVLQLIIYKKEKNAIIFTYPPPGSYNTTGLVVSSKFPKFSDLYTLTIESADPNSISANKPVELTNSVTKWFTKDGLLVEGLFSKGK